jgi:hypothetical protein
VDATAGVRTFGETTTITLNLDNPVLGIDGTPEDEGHWGPMTAYLYVNINDGDGTYLDDPRAGPGVFDPL